MIGITGHGAYVPRQRLNRAAVVAAHAWYAPHLAAKAGGARAMAHWDEDSITMAVAAARDALCGSLGALQDRSAIHSVVLASSTLPFAERLNAGVVAEALTLAPEVQAQDVTGSQRAALAALSGALDRAASRAAAGLTGHGLVLAADNRQAQPASTQELDFGDGAAALLVGHEGVIAEHLATATTSVDFVDHFRQTGETIDYHWEERWVRDEGITKLVPPCVAAALAQAGVAAEQVDHFIFPSTFAKIDQQLAKALGIRADAVVDALASSVGDTGVAHGLLLLSGVLERAQPDQLVVLAMFGSGVQTHVFRTTALVTRFRPRLGLSQWLARGVVETQYTKFLWFKQQLALDRGVRGEQDRKTALSTAWRHHQALLGLVAGRCSLSGDVHFPPTRLSYQPGAPQLDTQQPHPLAERRAKVLSWSAEYLTFHRSPPNCYGQVDFDGGGRILMSFTDVAPGDIDAGTEVEMVFRIKDLDELRGYTRYFWKATPLHGPAVSAATSDNFEG